MVGSDLFSTVSLYLEYLVYYLRFIKEHIFIKRVLNNHDQEYTKCYCTQNATNTIKDDVKRNTLNLCHC